MTGRAASNATLLQGGVLMSDADEQLPCQQMLIPQNGPTNTTRKRPCMTVGRLLIITEEIEGPPWLSKPQAEG